MNFFRTVLKKIKLFVLYWRRIVFVRNHFKVNIFTKIRCNISGGFLADQYMLYDLKHNEKAEYLSEFDWYRSRYINEPFDFAFNNKVICAEILKQYIRVAENLFIKNKGILYDFKSGLKGNQDVLESLQKRKKLIMKPFALGKGNGVHLLHYNDQKIYIDEKESDEQEFFKLLDDKNEYIVCEFIEQHSYADKLFDKTANTIRLITMRNIHTHENKIFLLYSV